MSTYNYGGAAFFIALGSVMYHASKAATKDDTIPPPGWRFASRAVVSGGTPASREEGLAEFTHQRGVQSFQIIPTNTQNTSFTIYSNQEREARTHNTDRHQFVIEASQRVQR